MLKTFIFVQLFLLSSLFAFTQSWEAIGPYGGWAQRVEFDPFTTNSVYLGGDFLHGLAKSSDNGDSWERVESYGTVDAWNLVFDYNTAGTMYAGTMMTPTSFDPFLLKSTDFGTSWDTIFKDIHITDVTLDPADSETIYLGAGQWQSNPARGYGHGVYKSTDGGTSFTNIGLDTLSIQSIKVHPLFSNVIFAGAYDVFGNRPKGVFASTDSGNSWFATGLQDKQVRKVTIGNTADSVVFVACFDSLYRSQNYGTSWEALDINGETFWDVDISLSDNNIIYTSTLGGVTPGSGGVFKSIDGGDTWSKVSETANSDRFWSISIHPTNPDLIFTTTQGDGTFRSEDGGNTWSAVNEGYAAHYISTIVPNGKGGIYAGFYNEHGNNFSSVMQWNEMDQWSNSGYEVDNLVQSIAVDPSDTKNIIISDVTQNFLSPEGGTAYYSTNSGSTFSISNGKPSNYFFEKMVIDRSNGNRVFGASSSNLGFTHGNGLYESLDGGKNWTYSNFSGVSVTDIIQDKFNPNKFYCSPYLKGFWSSNDQGVTWDSVGFGGWPLILDLEQDANDPDIFYASTFENGLLKSINGGATWQSVGFDGLTLTSVVTDPKNFNTIYVAGAGQRIPGVGVWKSENAGLDWEEIGGELSTKLIDEITIDTLSGYLFACTQGSGIFRYKIEDPLVNIFKAPSLNEVEINYSSNNGVSIVNKSSAFEYALLDLSGMILESGNSKQKEVSININHLNRGIYLVQVRTKKGVTAKKILKN